ncbi:MAG: polysaccharide biosynthesis protein [Clostridiales bacterium]|nr:polysaccharide biosynthesis protein [Clostridiales bacterium]
MNKNTSKLKLRLSKIILMAVIDYLTMAVAFLTTFFLFILFDMPISSAATAESVGLTKTGIFVSALVMVVLYVIVATFGGLFKIIHRYAQAADFMKFFQIFLVFGISYIAVMAILDAAFPQKFFRFKYTVILAILSIIMLLFSRLIYAWFMSTNGRKSEPRNGKRTLIVGCGDACVMLLNEIKHHPERGILPVVAVDKNEALIGRSIAGLRIEGTDDDIKYLCGKYDIELIIIAIPSANNVHRSKLLEKCEGVNAEVKMLPRVTDFAQDKSNVVDKIRDFTMEEVLGREPINIDHEEINNYFCGKTVLVTGGGGSIGSELCRQIAYAKPKKLIIVDIYENNAYDIQQELLYQYHKSLDLVTIIASVRDAERMKNIMATYKPEIVIHAAAHKHVPLMESSPQEAVKNNVFGTYNTAVAAIENGVEKFILISTDKAVNPTNIMGASKRMCEMVIQSLNGRGTKFSAVRFGNVLGSNGSVIPLFQKQIKAGGPVTVTHPDIIRFFMTIPEAVQLVLLAATKATGGEIFVLNMGMPVRIDDLAKRIIRLYGKKIGTDIEIKYTGLRPGEKLYEELMLSDENLEKTENDKIFIGHFVDFDSEKLHDKLRELDEIAENNSLSPEVMLCSIENKISEIVPTFHRTENQQVKTAQ